MNYKMPGTKIIRTLPAFLKLHKIKKDDNTDNKPSTHTRIGGKDKNGEIIYGGNYHIPIDALPVFWKLYHKWVFKLGNKEYLTETQDIENGGQGAPLVPIGDLNLFMGYKFCLNLGGFANISIKTKKKIQAFDICPVNTVLNYYSKKMGHEFDRNGFLSKSGKVDKILLSELNNLNFYKKPGPKSLGIEFVNKLIIPLIEKRFLKPNDILMTFIDHISFQINESVKKHTLNKILITGGGAFNKNLIETIKSKVKHKVIIPNKEIINFKEALIFAYLGILRINNEINCLKSVTGAKKNHSSGNVIDYNS